MAFDPAQMADETSYEGDLAQEPMSHVLTAILNARATGRLGVRDADGNNHLFFMQGRPVGVVLSSVVHPLGQLLLELGRVDATQFTRAQRLIGSGERLPGQVFIEIGALNEADLKDTLALQARRKAQRFVSLRAQSFEFNKGLSFLAGFKSTPLDGPPLVFHALMAGMDKAARETFLGMFGKRQLRATSTALGAPLDTFGFGRAEERFMQRLGEWHTVAELDQFGTLPREDIAALLRYLDALGQLEVAAEGVVHKKPEPAPAPAPPPPKPAGKSNPPRVSGRNAPVADNSKYGPAPNSAQVSTRSARDIGGGRKTTDSSLPSVVIDLGPDTRKR